MPENEKHKIEDIKRHLYDQEDTISKRHHEGVLHPQSFKVAESWETDKNEDLNSQNNQMKKPKTSIFKKFFFGSLIFFIGALSFTIYMFMRGNMSVTNENIDIIVLGNAFTKGGEELSLQIEIINRNNAKLELADLVISYPRGASDNSTDIIRLPRESLGTINPRQSVIRSVKVTLFGDEKSNRNVKISLEYRPEGSNAIFTKNVNYPVTISTAPLSLNIDAPDSTTSDQLISIKLTATLNTTLPPGNTMLQMTYPNGFVYDSALPAPTVGNSLWSLASLSLTNPVVIEVKGRLVGADGEDQVFHAYAGTTSADNLSLVNVIYASLLKSMTITKPFLATRILVNNQDLPSYTASGGDTINTEVTWVNNLPTRITDGQIIVSISGNAFDRTTVNSLNGYYDSINNQIIWDKNTEPDLASIEPGARGSVAFKFKSFSLVGGDTAIKDPQILINVSIRGRQPSLGSTYSDVNNASQKIVKILSDFQIAASANYSSGPLPPKAETETRYTINWTLSNSSNTITGATARSILPIYINWVGSASSTNENIVYNAVTREVTWNIGTVGPRTGFDLNREASFIVSLRPSLSQIGSVPQLTKEVNLSGTDSFTGTIVKSLRQPITTFLKNDPTFKPGNERVIP